DAPCHVTPWRGTACSGFLRPRTLDDDITNGSAMATILLADFFGDSGYLLRAILRGLGVRAVLARSPAAARRAINEQAVKALLIDLRTPTDAHLELLDHAMLTRDGQLPMLAVLARQQRFRCDPRLARFPRGHFAGVIRPPLAGSTLQAALDSALAAARP